MDKFYARAVFFSNDAEGALRFYTEQLGFKQEWDFKEEGRTIVCQVSLFGFELILNQVWGLTKTHAGHGRVFIGLDDDQGEPLREHIAAHNIKLATYDWGRPTLVIKDLDGNELFFWLPKDDFTGLDAPAPGSA